MATQKKCFDSALRVNTHDPRVTVTSPVHIVITDMSQGNHGNSDDGNRNHHLELSLPLVNTQHYVWARSIVVFLFCHFLIYIHQTFKFYRLWQRWKVMLNSYVKVTFVGVFTFLFTSCFSDQESKGDEVINQSIFLCMFSSHAILHLNVCQYIYWV